MASSDFDYGETIRGFVSGQKVFDRYTLEKVLGRGGMAIVWLARDEKLDRPVALKFLSEVMARDKAALNDLRRETRKSLELTHPHIVRVYDLVDSGEVAAIAMEYVEGTTLTDLRLERPNQIFEPADLEAWLRQLCEALDYAHARGKIVHRDLKPANLMVDRHGDLKITDFGISASLSDSRSRVSNVGTSGTLAYMSPQQLMGEQPAAADDIYALGATLYELLTGKPPFYSGNLAMQVPSKVPPTIAERRAELEVEGGPIPEAWEQTIAACLAKEPEARPQSAGEVVERMTGEGGRMKERCPRGRATAKAAPASRSVRPRRPLVPFVLSALFVLSLLGATGYWFGIHQPEQRRLAEVARLEAEASAASDARERARLQAEAERLRTERERQEATRRAEAERLANARGGIALDTEPSGAEVRIGGEVVERSPVRRGGLRLGTIPLSIVHPGYETWEGEAVIEEDRFTDLGRIPLERSTGRLRIGSEPDGINYRVSGQSGEFREREGRTPVELEGLPTGNYTVVLSRPGWEDQSFPVAVERHDTASVLGDFADGEIVVESTPSGAAVLDRGGDELGVTPLRLEDMKPGDYAFTLRRQGYQGVEVKGRVTARTTLRLRATLEEYRVPVPGENYALDLGGGVELEFIWIGDLNAWVGKYEVTNGEFRRFRSGHDSGDYGRNNRRHSLNGDRQPVVRVSYEDAVAFAEWLSGREPLRGSGVRARLLSGDEWTAIARCGTSRTYPWGNSMPPTRGNYSDLTARERLGFTGIDGYRDGHAVTAPVEQAGRNEWGLYGVGGNVWEWTSEQNGSSRALRGASWYSHGEGLLRVELRFHRDPSNRLNHYGFRVLLSGG